MSDLTNCRLSVNGRDVDVLTASGATLLITLRDDLRILSCKRGCNQGVCGSCTVLVDDRPVRACLSVTENCRDSQVRTLEGLSDDLVMRALQERMVESGGVQCGFCTAGMLISARDLLAENPSPSVEDVQAALSGNLCRCTGYRKIIDAVRAAADDLATGGRVAA